MRVLRIMFIVYKMLKTNQIMTNNLLFPCQNEEHDFINNSTKNTLKDTEQCEPKENSETCVVKLHLMNEELHCNMSSISNFQHAEGISGTDLILPLPMPTEIFYFIMKNNTDQKPSYPEIPVEIQTIAVTSPI